MAARTFVGDSGGTARLARRIIVGDSGGVARVAKRIFVGDSGGTARLIFNALTIQHSDQSLYSDNVGSPASIYYILNASGMVQYSDEVDTYDLEQYVEPVTSDNQLEVLVTVAGSALDGGSSTTGSYIALGTSARFWGITQSSAGTKATALTVTIREVANTSNSLTRTIDLAVDYF